MRLLIILSLLTITNIPAGTIELKDGSQLMGDIKPTELGYKIQTEYLGEICINANIVKAATIDNGKTATFKPNSEDTVASQLGKISQNAITEYGKNAKVQDILADSNIMKAIADNNISYLMSNPKIKALMSDPGTAELLSTTK